jgi:hypothetical protein
MGLDVLSGAQLYILQATVRQFVSLEKDVFLFQPPAQSGRGIEKPKSLKV